MECLNTAEVVCPSEARRGHARLAASQCEREAQLAASREQLDELDRELQSRAQAQDGIPILTRVAVFPATRVHSFPS